jgi:hypothetical protein
VVVENKITAEGEVNGIKRYVECFMEDGSPIIEVDYDFDEKEQERFNELLKNPPALGGTYYPLPNSLLAAYAVLQHDYFDDSRKVKIKVIGNIGEIPHEKEVVY